MIAAVDYYKSDSSDRMYVMKEKESITERRGKTSNLIENLLNERKQLLSLLLQSSNINVANLSDSDPELLDEFCQVLVDYIAACHFGLYERIVEGTERRKAVSDIAVNVYPRIEQTTQVALTFNEKYNMDKGKIDLSLIQQDLSKLGEELATRIELEDQLIRQLQSQDSIKSV